MTTGVNLGVLALNPTPDPNSTCYLCGTALEVPGQCERCADELGRIFEPCDAVMESLGIPDHQRRCPAHKAPLVLDENPTIRWECGCRPEPKEVRHG